MIPRQRLHSSIYDFANLSHSVKVFSPVSNQTTLGRENSSYVCQLSMMVKALEYRGMSLLEVRELAATHRKLAPQNLAA